MKKVAGACPALSYLAPVHMIKYYTIDLLHWQYFIKLGDIYKLVSHRLLKIFILCHSLYLQCSQFHDVDIFLDFLQRNFISAATTYFIE